MSEAAEKPFDATPQRIGTRQTRRQRRPRRRAGAQTARFRRRRARARRRAAAAAVARACRDRTRSARRVPWPGRRRVGAALPRVSGRGRCRGGRGERVSKRRRPLHRAIAQSSSGSIRSRGCKRMLSRDSLTHASAPRSRLRWLPRAMLPVLVACGCDVAGYAGRLERLAAAAWSASERVAAIACATGLLFAVAEFASARSAWLTKLRMSFEERKREAKEQEGDPHARGRRRALHRSLLRGAIAQVREAAFVVANPTHLAIALDTVRPPCRCRASSCAPPMPLRCACATLAAEYGIPVVENVALARALFRDGAAGEAIRARALRRRRGSRRRADPRRERSGDESPARLRVRGAAARGRRHSDRSAAAVAARRAARRQRLRLGAGPAALGNGRRAAASSRPSRRRCWSRRSSGSRSTSRRRA